MKILKIFVSVALIILALYLAIDFYLVKVYKDPVVSTLPEYSDKVFYEGGGTKGFTDYGKYIYDTNINFSDNQYFKKVNKENLKTIEEYISAYGEFVKKEYFYKDFDFKIQCVDEKDYYCILNRENKESYGIYKNNLDAFDLYIFDTDTCTLYFMHSNI